MDWVLIIFGTQVIKKKRPVRPVFPDYLSVSYDYYLTVNGYVKKFMRGIIYRLEINLMRESSYKILMFLFVYHF